MLCSTVNNLLLLLFWSFTSAHTIDSGNGDMTFGGPNDLANSQYRSITDLEKRNGQDLYFIFTYGDEKSGKICHAAIHFHIQSVFGPKPLTDIYVQWVHCAASGDMHEHNTHSLAENDLPIMDLIFQERYRLTTGPHWRYQIVLNQDVVHPSGGGREFGLPAMQPRADVIFRINAQGNWEVDHFCHFFGGGLQITNIDGSQYAGQPFDPLPHPDPGPSRRGERHRDFNQVCLSKTGQQLVLQIGIWLLCRSFCKPHPKRDVELVYISATRDSLLEAEGWKKHPYMEWHEAPEGIQHLPSSVTELDRWAEERGLKL
ncbi:hypothetical protein CKM354_000882500 [Cercospora kikuchii]|uniref:Uncharacterized protein n=1 Tax=Cercospora kikuchii TaxID=84275 RepID=A0A9P3CMV7_9PEZI|nr:uncharacterized protein CKM354_000882500 [Cercospora kikuchii]GIZ45668.1 hypothetical protein CKM354_000882500 [Cercospora kikuchii]